jgi:hypothetical protein
VRYYLRECGCFVHWFLVRVVKKAKDINLKFSLTVNALSHIKMDGSGNFEAIYHIKWLKKALFRHRYDLHGEGGVSLFTAVILEFPDVDISLRRI